MSESPPPLPRRPAGFGWRTLAFVLDIIPLSFLAAFLAERFADAEARAGRVALEQWVSELVEAYTAALRNAQPQAVETLSALALKVPETAALWIIHLGITFTLTFALGWALQEIFMAGRTAGKAVVNLRVIDVRTGEPPAVFSCLLRGAWKGIFCCFPNPLVSIVGLVSFHLPLFRKDGRSLHDLATFTQVVDSQDQR